MEGTLLRIEQLRERLHVIYGLHQNPLHREVIAVSQELDRAISDFYEEAGENLFAVAVCG